MSKSKVTPLAQWRQAGQGVEIELPSGNVAKVRTVSFGFLIRHGRIPNTLTTIVSEALNGNAEKLNRLLGGEATSLEDYAAFSQLLDNYCLDAFIEPRLFDGPENDTPPDMVHVNWIDPVDKSWVMQFIEQPVTALRSFRSKQNDHVEPLDATEGNGDEGE